MAKRIWGYHEAAVFFVNRDFEESGILEFPFGVIFDHDVEDGEKFSETGNESEFEGFSFFREPLIEGLDDGIATHGGDGGHVEDGTNTGSSSPHGSSLRGLAAISIEGRDTDECGDLLAIQLSEFGQFGNERCRRSGSDPGDALKQVCERFPLIIVIDELSDLLIEFVESFFEEVDGLCDVVLRGLVSGGFSVIFLLRKDVNHLSSARDQGVQLLLILRGNGGESEVFDSLREHDEYGRIDLVGLRQDVHGFSESANASW